MCEAAGDLGGGHLPAEDGADRAVEVEEYGRVRGEDLREGHPDADWRDANMHADISRGRYVDREPGS